MYEIYIFPDPVIMTDTECQYGAIPLKRQASHPVAKWFHQTFPHHGISSIFHDGNKFIYWHRFMFPACNTCVERRFLELLNILFFTVALHSTSHQIKDLILWWRKCSMIHAPEVRLSYHSVPVFRVACFVEWWNGHWRC